MLPDILCYEPPHPDLWQGRKDSLANERFFQHVRCVDIRTVSLPKGQHTALLGFCSDEGIRRNEGRMGAKEGPDALRQQLAKLACHQHESLLDIGNIVCQDTQLENSQQQFANMLRHCHQNQLKTIAFGGGHEIAFAHFCGLVPHYPKIGIINFDAHFDIRPLQQEHYGSSGTPFGQIKHYCDQMQIPFAYCCLGIQPIANTDSLFERAKDWDVTYLTAQQMYEESTEYQIAFLDAFIQKHDRIYLSICLDVFAECLAPGVSAPQAMGLMPWQVLPLLKYIKQTGKVVSMDIAELSPPLDSMQKTSRLAAAIVAEYLNKRNVTHE